MENKGGKNLAMMQEQQKKQQNDRSQVASNDDPSQQEKPLLANPAPRPKGKDIAQLAQSISPDKQVHSGANIFLQPPQSQYINPTQNTQLPSQHPTMTATKPIGKDFASMSSRNAPLPQQNLGLQQTKSVNSNAASSTMLSPTIQSTLQNTPQNQLPQGLGPGTESQRQTSNPMSLSTPMNTQNNQPNYHQQHVLPQQLHLLRDPQITHAVGSVLSDPSMVPSKPSEESFDVPPKQQPLAHDSETQPAETVKPERKPTSKPSRSEANLSFKHSSPTSIQPLVGLKISSLLSSVDPTGLYSLEPDAEEKLVAIANDFANTLIKKAMKVAEHRVAVSAMPRNGVKRKRVEASDVALVLKKCYDITIPGLPIKQSKATLEKKVNLQTARVLGDESISTETDTKPSVDQPIGSTTVMQPEDGGPAGLPK